MLRFVLLGLVIACGDGGTDKDDDDGGENGKGSQLKDPAVLSAVSVRRRCLYRGRGCCRVFVRVA